VTRSAIFDRNGPMGGAQASFNPRTVHSSWGCALSASLGIPWPVKHRVYITEPRASRELPRELAVPKAPKHASANKCLCKKRSMYWLRLGLRSLEKKIKNNSRSNVAQLLWWGRGTSDGTTDFRPPIESVGRYLLVCTKNNAMRRNALAYSNMYVRP